MESGAAVLNVLSALVPTAIVVFKLSKLTPVPDVAGFADEMAVPVTSGAFDPSITVVVWILVVVPTDVEVSSGVPTIFLVFMLFVSCIEVVAGAVDGVIVSGNTDTVSCLEVSNGTSFAVAVFCSTDVVEFVMVVGCLGLAVGTIVVVGLVSFVSVEMCDSVVSDICLKVVVCLLVCA